MLARLACVLGLTAMTGTGCFIAYDYGGYERGPDGPHGGAGTGTGGAGGDIGKGGEGGEGGSTDTCMIDGSGSSAGERCRTCYESKCEPVLTSVCSNSGVCLEWYGCIADCCEPDCYRACDQGGVPEGEPIGQVYQCMCEQCPEDCMAAAAPPTCP